MGSSNVLSSIRLARLRILLRLILAALRSALAPDPKLKLAS
jgi:hypothetical protein